MLRILLFCFAMFGFIPGFCQLNTNAINATFYEFTAYIESINNEILIDARPEDEVGKGGFSNSIAVSTKAQLENIIGEIDKSMPILVYCMEGERSVMVCNTLIEQGFDIVINLEDGIRKHKKQLKKFNQKQEQQ
ncbi:MAG: rhodanese-like domain-containing protein [Salinivirgaceae bacterium]|nr:rhodanese-like domain-containing protein [Salinivirgaceae bacterium]